MKELQVRNRQRDQPVDSRFLRRVGRTLLEDLLRLELYELGVHLISRPAMAAMNESYLQHAGPTDVITFDHHEQGTSDQLAGEIFICVSVAQDQAMEFQTEWTSEVVRYLVHGTLHLRGYDDLSPPDRRLMKREENRLVRALERRFDLGQLRG